MNSKVRIVVLVDNNAYLDFLEKRWGLSIYVEFGDDRILFDTDSDPRALMKNAEALKIDLSSISYGVISHNHGDHTGGLELIAKIKPGLEVYVPYNSSLHKRLSKIGLKAIRVHDTARIRNNVFALGELKAGFGLWEIALVIKINNNLLVFAGCSHPGIDNIVRKAVSDLGGEPYLVIGGFHSPSREALDYLIRNVKWKISPIHCSGSGAVEYVEEKAPEKLLIGGSGREIVIDMQDSD